MKNLFPVVCGVCLLGSCVFEQPFEPEARLSADPAIAGLWREVVADVEREPNRLLVLAHSDHEWLVQYPVGEAENTMFFRACPIELAGGGYVQIQLIGNGKGPVKPKDRKYHLLKMNADGDALEIMTLNPDKLGKTPADTQSMREAFARVRDEPDLFGEALRFNRQQ
ncbi:MAG TPA: hypothetical protein VLO11_10620 [Luteolibacter sp.]|nr:hypothetical protein [Luteolibacter sp.]